jgi:serine phosphatase RsbU (regulator of sigma subunit)/anti-sigma regulatory factor (Ser/Thr protein kinase)
VTDHSEEQKQGRGQVVLELDASITAPAEQVRDLYKLSDPQLSELGFEPLLDELLVRVRDLLAVDTAAVLLLDDDSEQLVARAAKGIEEEVEQGVRIPIGRGFAGRIADGRVAIFIADVDHADILNPILREKGIRSLLGVPLIVEGELIGVLHVGSLQPRIFDQRDLAVLELAAARAAPAIERAKLQTSLRREHRIAMMLQKALLPRRLTGFPGVSIAARYIPARDEVGGDWYDVIELSGGRIGIAIGDVVGHGVNAATLMGQLRTALHAYAAEGHGAARTLELVDRFASSLGEVAMATAGYAVVDKDRGVVRYACAGHLPPVLIDPGGRARAVEVTPAPPIGAFAYAPCPEHEIPLEEGAIIVLYTDGLIERPRVSLDTSIEKLVEVLNGTQLAEEACVLAVDRMVPVHGSRDDVAVLALRNDPTPTRLYLELAAEPAVLSHVRRAITRWLAGCGVDRNISMDIVVAVGEACANAIEHAYGPGRGTFRVAGDEIGDELVLSVSDRGRWRAPRGDGRGRGLTIMNAAMDHVEVQTDESGTRVEMRRNMRPR